MNQLPKNKRTTWILIGVMLVIILSSFWGGNSYLKSQLKKQEEKYKEKLAEVERKRDSAFNSSEDYRLTAENMRFENDEFRQRNQKLLYELDRQYKISRRRVDTGFISNAKYISISANRFYQEQDSLR